MIRFQLNEYIGVLRTSAVSLVKGQIVRYRQTDIVADALQLVRRNYLPNRLLNAIDIILRRLNSHAGWHPHVEAHHARIDGRKEVFAGDAQHEHRGRYNE